MALASWLGATIVQSPISIIVAVLFNIRFNPDGFPGSDYVNVTRHAENAWTIEALSWHRARLVTPGTVRGKSAGPTDEGTYYMPFRIDFTVP